MKKLTASALALLLLLSFPIAAFADGTTTLTAVVPGASYTLNITEDQTIVYGKQYTDIGNVTITNASNFTEEKNVQVRVIYGDFTSNDTTTTIPFRLNASSNTGSGRVICSGTFLVFLGKTDGTVNSTAEFGDLGERQYRTEIR